MNENNKSFVRTRFAPSPTGLLHIGGARTALFAYLYAKKMQGQFILRIEDTDRERSTEASVQAILQGMQWLGLKCDEGPFYQTHRFSRYKQVVESLLKEGKAYRCNCSKSHLESVREEQMRNKEKPRYNGHCRDRDLPADTPGSVVRFKNPQEGTVVFHDAVRGRIEVSNAELDDLIIERSDGTPTYNFTVVIDDADMNISHVIRGDDHINNTPRQINLLHAIGCTPPVYAHVPMILGEDGKRLSKRHGAVGVMQYEELGIVPEALLNYLVRLGWAHGDQEVFSLDQMIELFSLDSVSKSPACFSMEKLLWLNQHYIKTLPATKVSGMLLAAFNRAGIDVDKGASLEGIIEMQRERVKDLSDMVTRSLFFYRDFDSYDEKAAKKNFKPQALLPLQALHEELNVLPAWEKHDIHQCVLGIADRLELKLGKVAQPLRVAVSGTAVSPPIDETLYYLGRECVIARIARAIEYISHLSETRA